MAIGRRRGRILAFQALDAWDIARVSAEELAQFSWMHSDEPACTHDDLIFPRLLLLGTLEHLDTVDSTIIKHLTHWDFERITKVDKAILRLSTYSLLFQHDIAAKIVINEAVSIAHDYGTDDSFKFINAVLDSIKSEQLEYLHET